MGRDSHRGGRDHVPVDSWWRFRNRSGDRKRTLEFVPKDLARPGRDRGVSYWPGEGAHEPRVIYAISDRLYALDMKTGMPISSFGNSGMVNLRDEVADKYPNALYTISSPATIYKDLAIISPSTQEFGSKGPSGDPRAFDIVTGNQVWRFHTVPQPGEPEDGSWGPEGWKERAGPSAWGGATLDPTSGLVYIPVGNPGDSYNGVDRPGKNLYANSVIALDASTGKLKWFYQFTHHDINDLDAPAAPSLIDIRRNGQMVPALVEVPKSGIAIILDRRTPTQPFPLKPQPLVKMSFMKQTAFLDSFEGKKFNSPNDLVFAPDGSLWITDPPYGLTGGDRDPAKELSFNGVFRYAKGKLTAPIRDLTRPNGIGFTSDGKTLYVSNSGPKMYVEKYDVAADGTVSNGTRFIEYPGRAPDAPDGLKLDSANNLWTSGPGGIRIISPAGTVLGQIKLPETAANLAWADGGKPFTSLHLQVSIVSRSRRRALCQSMSSNRSK